MKKLFYSFVIILSMMFLYKTSSFADSYSIVIDNGIITQSDRATHLEFYFADNDSDRRFVIFGQYTNTFYGVPCYQYTLFSNKNEHILSSLYQTFYRYGEIYDSRSVTHDFTFNGSNSLFYSSIAGTNSLVTSIPVFYDMDSVYSYLESGTIPESAFMPDLELDSFDVWSYGVRDTIDNYSIPEYTNIYEVKWSDSRISTVKVRIDSVLLTQDFVSQSSPYKNYFRAGDYADVNGDVITLTATPYTSDGHYGMSMYYSFTYDGNNLVTNILRKFIKNKHYDNTIEIPFNGTDKTYDVDGVTTNNVYKVYYNPETNEYNDFYLYEIVYSPIIVYPYETPAEEITDTQTVVNNNYVTNNYYETTQNINVAFDFNFEDVTTQEVQDTYDDIGGFFDGFGVVVGRLVDLLTALFPFLSPAVATFILAGFALIVTLGVIALVIKIASIIADFIPL